MFVEYTAGFLAPVFIYALIFILNAVLPGRWVTGYVTKAGSSEKLRYRLNGIVVLFTVIILWLLAGHFNLMSWNWLYLHRWEGLVGAVVFGLVFSFAGRRPLS